MVPTEYALHGYTKYVRVGMCRMACITTCTIFVHGYYMHKARNTGNASSTYNKILNTKYIIPTYSSVGMYVTLLTMYSSTYHRPYPSQCCFCTTWVPLCEHLFVIATAPLLPSGELKEGRGAVRWVGHFPWLDTTQLAGSYASKYQYLHNYLFSTADSSPMEN